MRSSTAVGIEFSTAMRTMVSTPETPRSMTRFKPAGAALEMKAQGERMQMPEGAVGELAHGILGDHGEPHVAELREHHHQHAADAIGDDEHGRDGGKSERRKARRSRSALASPVRRSTTAL